MLLMNAFTSSQTVGSLTSSAMKDVQMSIDVLGLLGEKCVSHCLRTGPELMTS